MFGKIWKKIKHTAAKIVRIVKEVVWRVVGLVDLFLSWLGIQPKKYLRLRVYILTNLKQQPLQTEAEVMRWIENTKKTFKDRMNIEVLPPDPHFPILQVIQEPAPADCVFANSGFGDMFTHANDWFEDHCTFTTSNTTNVLTDLLGFGEVMYVFIVHNIDDGDRYGVAFPLGTDYCLVAKECRTTTMAHEMCHLGGVFPHSGTAHNLMKRARGDMDDQLKKWQAALVRNSRYVVFAPPSS